MQMPSLYQAGHGLQSSALGLAEITAPRPCSQHTGLQGKRNLLSTSTSHPTALPSNSRLKESKPIISIREPQQLQAPRDISSSPTPAQAAQQHQQISTGQLWPGFLLSDRELQPKDITPEPQRNLRAPPASGAGGGKSGAGEVIDTS